MVLLMMLFVMFLVIPSVMATTGECSGHRDNANHEAQADRGRDFIDLDLLTLPMLLILVSVICAY